MLVVGIIVCNLNRRTSRKQAIQNVAPGTAPGDKSYRLAVRRNRWRVLQPRKIGDAAEPDGARECLLRSPSQPKIREQSNGDDDPGNQPKDPRQWAAVTLRCRWAGLAGRLSSASMVAFRNCHQASSSCL